MERREHLHGLSPMEPTPGEARRKASTMGSQYRTTGRATWVGSHGSVTGGERHEYDTERNWS